VGVEQGFGHEFGDVGWVDGCEYEVEGRRCYKCGGTTISLKASARR
jgi:hypothetical protein